MKGYLHEPEKTADAVRDGWYNTGDVGHVEPDGFIRITGRVSRFAKIAGEMVPLERLDDEMQEILAAGGDRVLAVAAVPDEKRGERVIVLYLREIERAFPICSPLSPSAASRTSGSPIAATATRLTPCQSSAAASSISRSSTTWRRIWRRDSRARLG